MPPTYTIRNYTGPRRRSFNDIWHAPRSRQETATDVHHCTTTQVHDAEASTTYGTLLDHAKRRPPTDTIGTTTQVHDADASTTYGTLVDHAKRRPPTHTIGTTQVHDADLPLGLGN